MEVLKDLKCGDVARVGIVIPVELYGDYGRIGAHRREGTDLEEVDAIRLHAVHPLAHGVFDDLAGDFGGAKDAPFGRADDFDRGLDVLYGAALGDKRKEKKEGGRPGR